MEKNIWSEFADVSQKDWFSKIKTDLKGRDMNDLNVKIGNLVINPFSHADDFATLPHPLKSENGNWLIGEEICIHENNYSEANKQVLNALMRGVQSPVIRFDSYPNSKKLEILLDGVEIDYVTLNFSEKTANQNPIAFLETFVDYAKLMQKNHETLTGSIRFDPFADGRHDRKTSLKALEFGKKYLPNFKIICVDAQKFFTNANGVVDELTQTLVACNNYLSELTALGVSPKDLSERMMIICSIGTNYFVEIAKLRALRILWQHLLKGYESASQLSTIKIEACIQPQQKPESPHQNKISASTQIMSAVIGGADYICTSVQNLKSESGSAAFNNRILTNTEHLLSMESYFDRVADPLAGSYYVEQLTNKIAEATWNKFREQEK